MPRTLSRLVRSPAPSRWHDRSPARLPGRAPRSGVGDGGFTGGLLGGSTGGSGFGAGAVTVKLSDAGVASTLPAGSIVRTSKVCGPSPSVAVVWPELQEPQAPPSMRHSKLEPAWLDEKVNVGVGSFVGPDGPLSMAVSGAAVSTMKLRDAGVASTFPAGSVARASKLWAPSASDAVVTGVEHEPHAPPSTRHSNVESAWLAEKANVGVESLVGPDGPLSMVVFGAAVSTVKPREAGVGSTFPAGSVARTSNVCAPSASDVVV